MLSIEARIAQELNARPEQVVATVKMLDEGSTVPFIARYRKEATGGLDDTQLRTLEERLRYLRELEERRTAIIASVEEQGKMTPALKADILGADSKARLEDLYLPYKQKRRTKGQIAREAGLEPLADALLADPTLVPETTAAGYVDPAKDVADVKAALDGARAILVERFAEDAALVGQLRDTMWGQGILKAAVVEGKQESGAKFRDYFEHAEGIARIPSHRALALFRGRKEEVLTLNLGLPEDTTVTPELRIAAHNGIADKGRAGDKWLLDACRWCWRTKLSIHIEIDLLGRLFDAAEEEAIKVFAGNLRDLLLAAPAGQRATLALDPGFRTGVKVAAIDATGKLVETSVIYPHEPQRRWDDALMQLASLCRKHKLELIAIGNGTASRETEKLAGELSTKYPELGLTRVVVSEAGASIYSASAFAAQEFPDVDVSLRGAVSIGRRLQDPLAELVKIDPKSIGVGQYQHDLSENKLGRTLDAVVEDCVNAVGVDLNTASVPLLTRVSGLSDSLARNIVAWRDANGAFKNRNQLKDVSRLGPKAFEQAAGFLRVPNGDDPLDASTVHPEAYPVVRRILKATGKAMADVIGDGATLRRLNPADFTDDTFGVPTVKDILSELEKPGNDPRPEFKQAKFDDAVQEMKDLKPGMILEGAVTNVTNFGAFVDIGVHQDGLVHISALADKFVKDPREVVKPGQVVRVKVLEVDLPRKRIALTMKMGDQPAAPRPQSAAPRTDRKAMAKVTSSSADSGGGAMAAALAKAGLKQR